MNVGVDVITHFTTEDFPNMDEPEHWRIRDSSGRYFLIFAGEKWTNLGD